MVENVHSPPVLPVHAGAEVQVILLQAAAPVILDKSPGEEHMLVLHHVCMDRQLGAAMLKGLIQADAEKEASCSACLFLARMTSPMASAST